MKSRLSVRLSALFCNACSSVVSTRIDARFSRNEAPVFVDHEVCFKEVLIAVVHRLCRVEFTIVDDFLLNIPVNRSPDALVIYTTFLQCWIIWREFCSGCASVSKSPRRKFDLLQCCFFSFVKTFFVID